MDSHSVITHAADGIVKQLAERRNVSLSRMYEQLGEQCVYPKALDLIVDIGEIDPHRIPIIEADFLAKIARFKQIEQVPSDADLAKELHDVIHDRLAARPAAERLQNLREAIAALNAEMKAIEDETEERKLKAV